MANGSGAVAHPSRGFGSVSLGRKIAASIIIAVGIIFIAVTITNNLFAVGPAFEELIDDFRPMLSEESLATARADIASLEAAGEEFQTAVAPGMAEALQMSPEEFSAFVAAEYPAVAQGMQALPEITTTFNDLIDTLESQRDLFNSADEIPSKDLPATTVPWIITISGLLAIAFGVLMFFPGRAWPISAVVLGVVVIAASLILSLPQKAADADQLNENLSTVYTQELIDDASASLAVVGAMGDQLQNEMMPALAAQLGMSPDELNAFMAENFPATAAAIQGMPDAMERFNAFVGVFAANLDNYETIQPVSFVPIVWMLIIGSAVIVLMGGYVIIAKQ